MPHFPKPDASTSKNAWLRLGQNNVPQMLTFLNVFFCLFLFRGLPKFEQNIQKVSSDNSVPSLTITKPQFCALVIVTKERLAGAARGLTFALH